MIKITHMDKREKFVPLEPKRKFPKFLKKLFYFLIDFFNSFDDRLSEKLISFKHICVEEQKLSKACYYEYERVYLATGAFPKFLFIGSKEWYELGYELFDMNGFSFDFTPDIYIDDRRQFNGMKVIVVPWISGFFCLPDLNSF